jgi:hypothetical protein
MPSIIDPQNLNVDNLPAIWSPFQWGLTEVERIQAVEEQATASLFGGMDAPEAVLRLLLDETGIDRLNNAPSGYDVEQQAAWSGNLITFGPKRAIKLESCERTPTCLELVYDFGELGKWEFIIESEKVSIARI